MNASSFQIIRTNLQCLVSLELFSFQFFERLTHFVLRHQKFFFARLQDTLCVASR